VNFPNGWELILVLLVVVLVFGSKRLPESARALGRSMRILKAETKGLHDDDAPSTTTAHVVQPVAPPQPVQASPPPVQTTAQQTTAQQTTAQPVQTGQPYAGQQLFDAQGRPVQAPVNGSQPVQQAPHPQA